MFDFSSLLGNASELFGGVDTPDPAESLDADQLLQQVGIDPTNLSDLSAVNTEQLLSQFGTDGGGPDGPSMIDSLTSKLGDNQ